MKKKKSDMKVLKSQLHYWQMQGRICRRWVRNADEKVREIAKKMREIQKEAK